MAIHNRLTNGQPVKVTLITGDGTEYDLTASCTDIRITEDLGWADWWDDPLRLAMYRKRDTTIDISMRAIGPITVRGTYTEPRAQGPREWKCSYCRCINDLYHNDGTRRTHCAVCSAPREEIIP